MRARARTQGGRALDQPPHTKARPAERSLRAVREPPGRDRQHRRRLRGMRRMGAELRAPSAAGAHLPASSPETRT